jgi:acetyltransferase-like isoleucine patch superfamily enzyme
VWVSERAAGWIGSFGVYRRRVLFERLLPRVGSDAWISRGTMLTKLTTELGDDVYIGPYTVLGDVRIGDSVLISNHVSIPSGRHQHGTERLDLPVRLQDGVVTTIHIGADTWIGAQAVVLADVGAHCVVGAGAVVTRPVPDYAIVAGNPARQIGDRRDSAVGAPLNSPA